MANTRFSSKLSRSLLTELDPRYRQKHVVTDDIVHILDVMLKPPSGWSPWSVAATGKNKNKYSSRRVSSGNNKLFAEITTAVEYEPVVAYEYPGVEISVVIDAEFDLRDGAMKADLESLFFRWLDRRSDKHLDTSVPLATQKGPRHWELRIHGLCVPRIRNTTTIPHATAFTNAKNMLREIDQLVDEFAREFITGDFLSMPGVLTDD